MAPIIRLRARLNEVASWALSPGNDFKNHPIRAPWVSYYAMILRVSGGEMVSPDTGETATANW